jgi:branched-chain amino acid transport system ATP-binding protein
LPWLLLAVLAFLPVAGPTPNIVRLLFITFVWVTTNLGWNLLGGFTGQVSFGFAVFYGLGEPHLLLLDEPSLGLAPIMVDEIFKFVAEIVKHGVTILLVAQNIDYALEVSDYGYVMETGHMVLEGASDRLLNDPHVQYS